ncbi:MAG TPA: restriction endonuclease subunit S, partial [Candidatus Rubneribacter avistercoris]|nr:restriction endonuclease subunit S [Candidatus Rubneribacter avistercoris]
MALKITDGTHHSPVNMPTGDYMYVTAKNIKDDGVEVAGITYVSKAVHEEIYKRCNPAIGDILLVKDGATTGVVTVNNIDQPFSLLSSVALIKVPRGLLNWFLVYYLRTDLFNRYIRSLMSGTGIPRITLKKIEPLLVPLPPLAEQRRIVAKVEELMPLVGEYGKLESEREALDANLPDRLRK